jgi:DHA1 family tetracycline resistance protein-like MFS transporter
MAGQAVGPLRQATFANHQPGRDGGSVPAVYLLLGLALPLTGGMVMLYVARTLDGITGGNITIAQAYISDVTTQKDRAQGLGLVQAAFGMGFIFGPAFGGVLSNYGVITPFIGAALITTGTLLLTIFTLKESLPPEERSDSRERRSRSIPLNELLSNRPILLVLLVAFLSSLAFAALPATFSLYADRVLFSHLEYRDRVQLYIGLMLTFNGLMQVITQIALLKPLVTRLGERRLLIVGQASLVMAFFGIASVNSAIIATLLFAPYAFGTGVSQPSMQSLMTRYGGQGQRGQLLGTYQSARSLALILGPLWAGYVFMSISPQAVYFSGGVISILGLTTAVLLLQQKVPADIRQPPVREAVAKN